MIKPIQIKMITSCSRPDGCAGLVFTGVLKDGCPFQIEASPEQLVLICQDIARELNKQPTRPEAA